MPSIFSCIVDIPDRHVGSGHDGETDGSGETLVTLGIIVLEADLELDGLEEVSLLGLQGVFEEFLDVGTHSGYRARYQSALASYLRSHRRG